MHSHMYVKAPHVFCIHLALSQNLPGTHVHVDDGGYMPRDKIALSRTASRQLSASIVT